MATLEQLSSLPPTYRLIFYGAPGTGKTWAIGKLAETKTIYYFSLENGHRTLLNPECVSPEFRKNINVIQMKDTPEAPIASTSLEKFLRDKKGSFCESHGRFNCEPCKKANLPSTEIDIDSLGPNDVIVIDSLTQLAESIGFHINRSNTMAKGDFEYYRLLGQYLSQALSRLQVINNTSVIVISHEIDVETTKEKSKIVPAGGTRNFARNNARYFDGAYHFYRMNKSHRAASISTHSNTVDTKDRSGFDVSAFKNPANAILALFHPDKAQEILKTEEKSK